MAIGSIHVCTCLRNIRTSFLSVKLIPYNSFFILPKLLGFFSNYPLRKGCAVFTKKKKKFCFKAKQSEAIEDLFRMCFTRSVYHDYAKKNYFASFHFKFFTSNQSEIKTAFFCFVLLQTNFRFTSNFLLCFALKQKEINFFSLFSLY